MTAWLFKLVADALALAAAAWLLDGITVTGSSDTARLVTLAAVALVFGLVNAFVRPVVAFLAFPLYLLTLGLMFFVVNALMLLLTSWVAGLADIGFHVDDFWTALGGALIVSVASWLVQLALPGDRR